MSIAGTPVTSITTTCARPLPDPAQQLVGQLARAIGVERADERHDQQPIDDVYVDPYNKR